MENLVLQEGIKFHCFTFGVKESCFWKILGGHFKERFNQNILVLFIGILSEISIFYDFSNIYQFSTKNGMTLVHLYRYNSQNNRENYPKFCVWT